MYWGQDNLARSEWRNLILEENALGDHSRVESIATDKLKMQHVDPSQENIVVKQ